MPRAFLIVMDSVGCGGAPDADQFYNDGSPDSGANTLAHIAQACAMGAAEEGRSGPLRLPNLDALGLGAAIRLASGEDTPGLDATPAGLWGAATEQSPGKDTPTGHWELAGVPVPWDWHYFTSKTNSFPDDLIIKVCQLAGTEGILGDCHASGTLIIDKMGAEHMQTGWPICYTSVDSVFQIAAHEETFGLDQLLDLCRALAPTLHKMRVGRVIARPFTGSPEEGFTRTPNRRDFAMAPPAPTLCDWVQGAGRKVHAIGKIGDIFSMHGIDDVKKGNDANLMQYLLDSISEAEDGSLTFANFVEFDSLYGHRRDVSGYAKALEWFDAQLPALFAKAREGDLFVFTADHGNDPTWVGTDHTRERVPVVGHGVGLQELGLFPFTGVADLIAGHLGVEKPQDQSAKL
ncbi:phosphopentomutase [Actibacterium sp. XHP0104]|uniref:phosphopentomutase n=1 Tax=Actibacterium sp. XHP0104 TaxID=2984335 RepID=UPI0021E6EEF6|nr:phosphopentomutase [Actibacterium sp. XHP0104]MCV2882909.1 phosphopentomutase [Actibacterium sp. XHP0104]